MEIKGCRKCRKLFQFVGKYVCPACELEHEQLFAAVRDYIYLRPTATMDNIVENTGATELDVLGWLREGRLILDSMAGYALKCETCGTRIRTGRLCEDCNERRIQVLRTTAESLKQSQSAQPPAQKKKEEFKSVPRKHAGRDK